MSKYNPLSPCPFCGHDVRVVDFSFLATEFKCENDDCGATMYFDYGTHKRSKELAIRTFNTRSSCGAFTYILIGAALALIITVLCCMLFVTERAENVSHETISTQGEIVQEAAGDLAGDDTEAAGYAARMYTDADAVALAQMAYGECRGVAPLALDNKIISTEYQQACAMWVALNRFDAGFEGDSIADVIAAPHQFHGYDPEHTISEELLALAYDVLDRWQEEKQGAADVGRVLPAEYLFFVGNGDHNNFTVEYGTGMYYAWTLHDPYVEEA